MKAVSAASAAVILVTVTGTAGIAQSNIIVSPPLVNNNAAELQMQRSQIQMQTYQLQQQINRDQDRRNLTRDPQQPNVPVYHSTCTPTNGVPCN